jgi:hypothetical protein
MMSWFQVCSGGVVLGFQWVKDDDLSVLLGCWIVLLV